MLAAATWSSLVLFATVVSQPLFYWMALGRATRQLSAPAYVELRQQVNLAIKQRLTRLYIATLLSLLVLIVTAFIERGWSLAMGAWIALLALVMDVVLAKRLNVPINTRMDAWSLGQIPEDWQDQRVLWDAALGTRRIVLLLGFASLTLAIVAA
jgi:hypothetical protein